MRRLAFVLAVGLTAGSAEPVVTFLKYFKGSKPENVIITVNKNGETEYKEGLDDPQPLKFQLSGAEAGDIFALAEKLGRFNRPVESGLKVAQLGIKTFRFEDGSVKNEVKFNYSQDPDAQALLDLFERISESEQVYINLDSTVHFDKLGVNQSLLELQIVYDKKRLVAPQQFLPLLNRIINNESFLHMARERAASLADVFKNPPPPQGSGTASKL